MITYSSKIISDFQKYGFVILKNLIIKSEMVDIKRLYYQVIDYYKDNPSKKFHNEIITKDFFWIQKPELVCPDLLNLAIIKNSRTIIASLFTGDEQEIDISLRIFYKLLLSSS